MKFKYIRIRIVVGSAMASISLVAGYLLLSDPARLLEIIHKITETDILPYFVGIMFTVVPIAFFSLIRRWRKQSLTLIQMELDEGKKMYLKDTSGGVVDGMRYKGPLLTLAVFDDCFIFKDKKVIFSDIESIRKSRLSGVIVQFNNGQTIELYTTSFLQFIPKEHGGRKEPQA
jgi:hypothetical protein